MPSGDTPENAEAAPMTVPVQNPFTSSVANGVTTVFPYSFMIADEDDIKVVVDGVVQTSGYTVSGVGNPAGGNVTFSVAPANGLKVLRYLDPILWREIDYQQFGDFLADTVNLDFDKVWLALQALQQNFKRSLKLPVDTADDQVVAEEAAARVGKVVSFDASGNMILNLPADLSEATFISTFMETLLVAVDDSSARATLGVSGQLQEATRFTAGGTADAITGTLSPAIASYTAGLRVTTTPGWANTVTGPTLNLNSLGTKTIKKRSSSGSKVALVAGDYNASGPVDLEYDGTDFILLNPVVSTMTATVGGLVPTPPNNTTTFLRGDGTFAEPTASITLGTPVASTSGTSIDFTGIPSTAKRITINFNEVSTSGTSNLLVQIGDSGGIENTGYKSVARSTTATASTVGFLVTQVTAASRTYSGSVVLCLTNSANNTWVSTGQIGDTTANDGATYSSGAKSTSAVLDRVRITTVGGTETFDAGEINISYE